MAVIYTIALYLHRIGALGVFITIALEWFALWQMRRAAMTGQARRRFQFAQNVRLAAMPFILALLISGLYMMAAAWGLRPWILVALGALLLTMVITTRLNGPGLAAIKQALHQAPPAENGHLPATLQNMLRQPMLWAAMQIRVAVTLGVVFLMLMKPSLVESLLAILAAFALGLVLSIPALIQLRAPKESHPQAS